LQELQNKNRKRAPRLTSKSSVFSGKPEVRRQ
jgi:hypothetical protein